MCRAGIRGAFAQRLLLDYEASWAEGMRNYIDWLFASPIPRGFLPRPLSVGRGSLLLFVENDLVPRRASGGGAG